MEQIRVLCSSTKLHQYAQKVLQSLKNANIDASMDLKSDWVGNKIAKVREDKIPYYIFVNFYSQDYHTVQLNITNGECLGEMTVDEVIETLKWAEKK